MAKAEILEIKGPIKRSMIADNIELFEIKKAPKWHFKARYF
ncbi:hypothetical protein VLK81_05225 [Citroniella saccharovorans]|uniref:Uncharacterized protein n=1 Tax=Citroniella saccharovorans TaxID=2053367 RepID=A0AAW9MXW6_9FIRM|nr:hypothetical protein [Citroniella saccharovorans]MEB3429420.1 hypothetical protein [Citroniella saccharovorans]